MKQLFIFLSLLVSVNTFAGLEDAIIIDVRSEGEWNQGHLSRAQRVNWDEISNEIAKIAPDKNEKIILYCRSGNRAGKAMKALANNMKKGAPGGCPTSNLYAEAMNSPQSQKLAVGSTVSRYTIVAMSQTDHPVQTLRRLKRI